jgi:putative ATP-dependent endonuclease of OLD family
MHLHSVRIKNFRLLRDATLRFDTAATVIVGRNNSGKTSLTELFRRMFGDETPRFGLQDFSIGVHEQFWNACELHQAGADEATVRAALPQIEALLTFRYTPTDANLGALSAFVIDLDPGCSEAQVLIAYRLKDGSARSFFDALAAAVPPPFSEGTTDTPATAGVAAQPVDVRAGGEQRRRTTFFRALRHCLPAHFAAEVKALNPTDATDHRIREWSALRALLGSNFINAQRGLDDATAKNADVLGKVLEALFESAQVGDAGQGSREIVAGLATAIENIQTTLDTDFKTHVTNLLPLFELFGYPGLGDQAITTETVLDVERLLANHTKVRYAAANGLHLPEGHNGLGSRNLILILLRLFEFFTDYRVQDKPPGIHLVFIEEPEVHLHPQMQKVFMAKLKELPHLLSERFDGGRRWPVQFVVTTHASHIANQASFDAIRYFSTPPVVATDLSRSTTIKHLTEGLAGATAEDRTFLHMYMTLTHCDLLFADKAIFIEGGSERILLPRLIELAEANWPEGCRLSRQYVSILVMGGAHAHKIFPLLRFLSLRTLVITDLDTVKRTPTSNGQTARKSCAVSEGEYTSNGCLKEWFGNNDIASSALLGMADAEKCRDGIRIAYQVPETNTAVCGATFEPAFMLANPAAFGLENVGEANREASVIGMLDEIPGKTEFAFDSLVSATPWNVPRYIAEGLRWLADVDRVQRDGAA